MTESIVHSRCPQDPNDVVLSFPESTPEQVQATVEKARRAQRAWAATGPAGRSAALGAVAETLAAHRDEMTALVVREVGKPATEAAGEVNRAISILRYYAQQAFDPDGETLPAGGGTLLMSRARAHGVAGLITPWNFPIAIPVWKAAPALAFGNTVVLKPAEEATAVALRLEELMARHLPEDVFTVTPGAAHAGQTLIELANCLSFTGSASVGQRVRVAAAERGIPVQCEMGGQNPSIILPDADLESVAQTTAAAAMGYAGQKCTATSRVIVVGDPQPFSDALAGAIDRLVVGDPANSDVTVGPVISDEARRRVMDAAEEVRASGGRIRVGGNTEHHDGYFVPPTLFEGLPAEHRLNQEEVFGPFCSVLSAADPQQAVDIANAVPYGLAASVFTHDLDQALEITEQLEAGLVRVNAPTSGVDFYAPFGGVKDSSYGLREQGKAARAFYTTTRTFTIASSTG